MNLQFLTTHEVFQCQVAISVVFRPTAQGELEF